MLKEKFMSKKSKYKYEGYGVVRDTEIDFPYHTDDIVDLLDEKDQDKISFAVEQLEKARKLIDELLDNCGDKQYKVWEVFDNQINELKGE